MSQTIRGEATGSQTKTLKEDVVLERTVGECRTVEIKLQGVKVSCLLDTGSQVSTISEGFFNEQQKTPISILPLNG